jgi:hypothetical protein
MATRSDRVNYITMEDIPDGEQVLTSTLSLNGDPIVIMFDSRASHDFISKACTEKYQLDVHHGNTPYMISTPGGKIVTRHIARKTPLNLARKVFKVCLIVLDGQGIDVIPVMGTKGTLHEASRVPKILKLCMRLELNILNTFFNWVDFKFPTKFVL